MLEFFEKNPEALAVMSQKKDGQMKLLGRGYVGNRKRFLKKIGIDPKEVVSAEICHGKSVAIVSAKGGSAYGGKNNKQKIILGTDGIVTNKKGIFLAVTVADCVPVLFFEKKKKIIGIVHAGWRSTVGDIVSVAISKIEKLGGNPGDLKVEIGPAIGECHFEIGEDYLDHFKKWKKFVRIREGKYFVNLKGILKYQLEKNGVKKTNIKTSKICTYCDEKYFSARRDNDKKVQAGVVVIGMKQ
jgi:hypothetical protein